MFDSEINTMRYFIYSEEQARLRRTIEFRLGKKFLPGTVIVNGQSKFFTEIVDSTSKIKNSDAVIVAYTDIKKTKYSLPN